MNILVVDDQPEVVQGIISEIDWKKIQIDQVFSAFSVKEAKEVLMRENIDIMLCDIEMPPTDGFELLKWVQEQQQDIASILLSAHAEFRYAQKAVQLGIFDYILQPAPYDEIESSIAKVVRKVSENQRLRRYYELEDYRDAKPPTEPEEVEIDHRKPIQKAMDYIRMHIDQNLSRSDIANAIYLNPEYLSHLFKKETGSSLGDYIVTEKMRIAQSLLSTTNIQISLVASKVGYSNFSYFSQVFKKHTNFSPMEYRTEHQKNPT